MKRRILPSLALLAAPALALTACSSSVPSHSSDRASAAHSRAGDAVTPASTGGGSTHTIPVGPGPQKTYKVEPQPPAGSCKPRHDGGEPLNDLKCTPGATNPDVTQATLKTTICRSGYTKTIRPPESVTGPEKQANAKSYSYTSSLHDAEYDHEIPLEVGGDPNDPRNLWVEPPDPGHTPGSGVNNKKDKVENDLHDAVCSGKVKLTDAQQAIADDWTTAEKNLGIGS